VRWHHRADPESISTCSSPVRPPLPAHIASRLSRSVEQGWCA
jgi:hypothetical protein